MDPLLVNLDLPSADSGVHCSDEVHTDSQAVSDSRTADNCKSLKVTQAEHGSNKYCGRPTSDKGLDGQHSTPVTEKELEIPNDSKTSREQNRKARRKRPYNHKFVVKLEPEDCEMERDSSTVASVRKTGMSGSPECTPPHVASNNKLNSLEDEEYSGNTSKLCLDMKKHPAEEMISQQDPNSVTKKKKCVVKIKKVSSSREKNDRHDTINEVGDTGQADARSLPVDGVLTIKTEPCDGSWNSSEDTLMKVEKTNDLVREKTEPHPVRLYAAACFASKVSETREAMQYPSSEWSEKFNKRTRSAPKGRSEERPHVCEVCDAAFTQYVYLKRHRYTHSDNKPHQCPDCNKSFIRRSQLQVHVRVHSGEKPYKCSLCDASFSQTGHLQVHMRSHTGEKPFSCDKCGSTFTSSSHLNSHIRCVHVDERPYACLVCSMTFNTPANLRLHCRTHSGEKPYKCDQCSAAFAQSGNLKQHQVRHTWERPHTCQFCGLQFARLAILHQHYYTHQQELEDNCFTCPQCTDKFQNAGLLHSHIKKEHGLKRTYRCKYCPSTFSQSCNLKRHVLTHSGLKPFPCSKCDTAFTQHSHLQRHMKRLHSEGSEEQRPHKCQHCQASFMRVSDLKRHGKLHIAAGQEKPQPKKEKAKVSPRIKVF